MATGHHTVLICGGACLQLYMVSTLYETQLHSLLNIGRSICNSKINVITYVHVLRVLVLYWQHTTTAITMATIVVTIKRMIIHIVTTTTCQLRSTYITGLETYKRLYHSLLCIVHHMLSQKVS